MTTIFIATDTSGNWKWKENTAHPGQPHLIRLAMLRDDDDTRPLSTLVKLPQGAVIEPGAIRSHGITADVAARTTAEASDVLDDLLPTIMAADSIVAFGADFHRKVLEATLLRTGRLVPEWRGRWACAMAAAAGIKGISKVSDLRAALVGKLPDWRPDEAQFSADWRPVATGDDDEAGADDDASEGEDGGEDAEQVAA